ncbi:hypothetical protein [Geovibrio ferrireducens]|uniref:hypothetical protein n=1 Tax=Geovibrio ferrireducens TaxID=46201 RepID=UPI002246B552|nr:hypothetical protein [Geovibrio ferrireducens]
MITLAIGNHITEGYKPVTVPFRRLHLLTQRYNYSAAICENGYRLGSKLQGFTNVLMYDFDDGTPMDETKERFEDFEISCFITTSRNHQKQKGEGESAKPPCDRYRLIIPLSAGLSVTAAEYHDFYIYFSELTGLSDQIDTKTKDTVRMYFPNPNQIYEYVETGLVLETERLVANFRAWHLERAKAKAAEIAQNAKSKSKPKRQYSGGESMLLENELAADTLIQTKKGYFAFSDFDYLQPNETAACHCPNPAHPDRNPSAFIGRSNESGQLFVKCSGCGYFKFMCKERDKGHVR